MNSHLLLLYDVRSTSSQASQTDKKEDFRKYLEKGRVLAVLTTVLTDLFEMVRFLSFRTTCLQTLIMTLTRRRATAFAKP